jgi:hypothetical protein
MKTVLAAVFVAALACAQENLPEPAPVPGGSKPAPAAEPAKPTLKATPPATAEPPPQPPKPLTSREAADTLTIEELKQVIDLLRENYIRPDSLSEEGVARAGVQGVLDRLGAGARVFSKRVQFPDRESPFRHEIIGSNVAYIRLGALNFENLAALDKALNDNAAKPPPSLVLDLRASPPSADFEFAAEVCRRFCPRGRILFSIKRPKANDEEILTSRDEPRWRGLLVVLVDGDTAGCGEVIAAVLRTHLRAYVVGQRTQGEAAQFEDLPLGQGKVLRVAIGEVTLPDNSPVFPGGLQPDLAIALPQEQTDAALAAALSDGVASLVEEKERPRMNEAALVAGINPELDAMREQQLRKARGEQPKTLTRDLTLQRALDYITGVSVFEAARKGR